MSRYSKEHYEDVARILWSQLAAARLGKREQATTVLRWLADNFADLFAADNPTRCVEPCGHEGTCDSEHRKPGFDREKFLAACGLAEKGVS